MIPKSVTASRIQQNAQVRHVYIRNGLVWKICTSGGRQCKTVPIPGLRVLVYPNQTWTFSPNSNKSGQMHEI